LGVVCKAKHTSLQRTAIEIIFQRRFTCKEVELGKYHDSVTLKQYMRETKHYNEKQISLELPYLAASTDGLFFIC